jgi:hypothetical protein
MGSNPVASVEERISVLELKVQELQVELMALRGQAPDNVAADVFQGIKATVEKAVNKAKEASRKALDAIKAEIDKERDGEA